MRPIMRRIIANVWQTPDGTVLWSKSTHDFQSHTDALTGEEYFADGGTEYIRVSDNIHTMKNLCVYSTDPHEKVRQWALRGTLTECKDGTRKHVYVRIADVSDSHLENIIKWNEDHGITDTVHHRVCLDEAEWRKMTGTTVPETDYENYKL